VLRINLGGYSRTFSNIPQAAECADLYDVCQAWIFHSILSSQLHNIENTFQPDITKLPSSPPKLVALHLLMSSADQLTIHSQEPDLLSS
jgi:hypothetical protein